MRDVSTRLLWPRDPGCGRSLRSGKQTSAYAAMQASFIFFPLFVNVYVYMYTAIQTLWVRKFK